MRGRTVATKRALGGKRLEGNRPNQHGPVRLDGFRRRLLAGREIQREERWR